MSRLPLLYRDWWDDFELPTRTSKLFDQHFGTGIRRDDLLSSFWSASPSLLRTGYIRPWHNNKLQKPDSGSTLNIEKDCFQVILDVQQFTPNEITVKTSDKFVTVEGKHEEKPDEHGFISRQFTRRYILPTGIDPNEIASTLSSDGVLTITAPLKSLTTNSERLVPITQTDAIKKEQDPQPTTIKTE